MTTLTCLLCGLPLSLKDKSTITFSDGYGRKGVYGVHGKCGFNLIERSLPNESSSKTRKK